MTDSNNSEHSHLEQDSLNESSNNNPNTLGSESKTTSNQNPEQLELFQRPDAHEIQDGEPQRSFKPTPSLTTVPEKTEPTVTKPVSTKAVRQQPKKTNKQRSTRLEKYPVPLENFLTREDRGLLDTGIGEGGRNNTAAKIGNNIIGTANTLNRLGIDYYPNAYDLFIEFCQKCPSTGKDGWDIKHWDRVYQSLSKKNPTPSLSDDALLNCAKAYWKKNQSSGNKKLVTSKNINPLTGNKGQLKQQQKTTTVSIEPVNLLTLESLEQIKFPNQEIRTGKFDVYDNGVKFIYNKETRYFYSIDKSQWIARYELPDTTIKYKNQEAKIVTPSDKACRHFHIDSNGKIVKAKGDKPWLPYGLLQIQSLDQNFSEHDILAVEGEKCVEFCFSLGIPAIEYKRINRENIDLILSSYNRIIVLPDNDKTGFENENRLRNMSAQFVTVKLSGLEEGDDIVDYITQLKQEYPNMSNKEIQEHLVAMINDQLSELKINLPSSEVSEQTQEEQYQEDKKHTPQTIANELSEQLADQWVFSQPTMTWYQWNGKKLVKQHDRSVKMFIKEYLDDKEIEYRTPRFIDNVAELLSLSKKITDKTIDHWNAKGFINFDNGVLDTEKKQLLLHSIGYRFTSLLPRPYQPLNIEDKSLDSLLSAIKNNAPTFFNWAMTPLKNNEKAVLKLLAIMNGILTYKFSQLEYFLYLVGKPGTGKGTFLRLLEKLVGDENHAPFTVSKLNDGNEIDLIIDKQLAVSGDVRELPSPKAIEVLLRLSGKDGQSYRKIYKESAKAKMLGTIAIASNNPIFVGNVEGIDRRLCLLEFDNPIPDHLRNSQIEDLLELDLPQLTSIALAMPDDLVTQFIKGVDDGKLPEFKAKQWEMKCQVNSIASWINEHLIYDIGSSEPIGTAKNESNHLYRNYLDYCESTKMTPKQLNNFSSNLIDICQEIGWNVSKKKGMNGARICNIRLRKENDHDTPTHLENLESSIGHHKPSWSSYPLQSKDSESSLGRHRVVINDDLAVINDDQKDQSLENNPDITTQYDDLAVIHDDPMTTVKPIQDKQYDDHDDLETNFSREKILEDENTLLTQQDDLTIYKEYLLSCETKTDLSEMIEMVKKDLGDIYPLAKKMIWEMMSPEERAKINKLLGLT